MLHQRVAFAAMLFVALCALTACGDDSTGGTAVGVDAGGGGGGGAAGAEQFSYDRVPAAADTRLVRVEGGFVLAGRQSSGAMVSRFTDDFALVWEVEVRMARLENIAVDEAGRIVLVGHVSQNRSDVVRLLPDGSLDVAFSTPSSIVLTDVAPLPDGRMMFNDGTLVDEDFTVLSRGDAMGELIIAVDDGFVMLDNEVLTLRKVDMEGLLVWEHRVEIPAANYYPIGLRALDNGDIIAATSGDVNPGNVLVAARLGSDGVVQWLTKPRFEGEDRDGRLVPLQFGTGIQLAGAGGSTYATFLANSGGLGSDVRQKILAEIDDATGSVVAASYGGGGVTIVGSAVVSAGDGTILSTDAIDGTCVGAPVIFAETLPITTQPTPRDGERMGLFQYELMPAEGVSVVAVTGTLAAMCPAE